MKSDETDLAAHSAEGVATLEVDAPNRRVVAPLPLDDRAEVLAYEAEGVTRVAKRSFEGPTEGEIEASIVAEESETFRTAGNASADVVPLQPRHRFPVRLPRLGRGGVLVLAFLFMFVLSGVAYATYDYNREYDGKLLPGIVIAGVDVGGMTPDEAERAVNGASKIQLDRKIIVRFEEKTWRVTPRELGAKSNAAELVDAAVASSDGTGLFKRVGMAVLGDRLDYEHSLAITYPRQGARGFIDGAAAALDRDPVDATVDYSSGWLEFVDAKEGRKVLKDKSLRSLMRSLRRGRGSAVLSVKETQPAVTEHEWKQVLLLRIGENKLYLYEDGKIVRTYTVATGQPEYPTPTGIYEITEKRYMPTWVNPDPTGWGAGMPASIGPGPGNPLGTRALNWSASGIRFHGTEATYSLGYNASHGCVRMAMADVEELYDLVEVGTPIVSLIASPLDPMYTSSPDPGPAN